ncbi:hypothetical protein OAN96_00360 [Candidatus Gracilibacteria bacterium]|nr:hypothetical protein [Candidatus Gracilibacteria bacterium]
MILHAQAIIIYILYCIRLWANPWMFFQINNEWFNEKKGFFSKMEMNQLLPKKWQLKTYKIEDIDLDNFNLEFPVFLKPEYGHRSYGVYIVKNKTQLKDCIKEIRGLYIPYIVQGASKYNEEYEITFINNTQAKSSIVYSISEAINKNQQKYIIHSTKNGTQYVEHISDLKNSDIKKIESHISRIPSRVGRISLKSNSIQDIINGDFEIFEINLFLASPLYIQDKEISFTEKCRFMLNYTKDIAKLTKTLRHKKYKHIFWNTLKRYYLIKHTPLTLGK